MFREIILPIFRSTRLCVTTQAVTHSLVLLKMGVIIARSMLSWLELLINRYCCIYLVVYIIYTFCKMFQYSKYKIFRRLSKIKMLSSRPFPSRFGFKFLSKYWIPSTFLRIFFGQSKQLFEVKLGQNCLHHHFKSIIHQSPYHWKAYSSVNAAFNK